MTSIEYRDRYSTITKILNKTIDDKYNLEKSTYRIVYILTTNNHRNRELQIILGHNDTKQNSEIRLMGSYICIQAGQSNIPY